MERRSQPSSELFDLFYHSALANRSLSFGLSELTNNRSLMKRNRDLVPFFFLPLFPKKKVRKEEL